MKKLGDTQYRYTPNAGTVEDDVHCGVCGDMMLVKRDCYGPRSYAQAVAGGNSLYDEFTCPNMAAGWHTQVVALRREANRTSSGKITAMLKDEIEQVLKTREPTKQIHCTEGF